MLNLSFPIICHKLTSLEVCSLKGPGSVAPAKYYPRHPPVLSYYRHISPPLSLRSEQARFLCFTFIFAILSYESRLNLVITEYGDISEVRSKPVVIASYTERFPTTKERTVTKNPTMSHPSP